MPQKGLKKGDGVWGSGKELSLKVFSRFSKKQNSFKIGARRGTRTHTPCGKGT